MSHVHHGSLHSIVGDHLIYNVELRVEDACCEIHEHPRGHLMTRTHGELLVEWQDLHGVRGRTMLTRRNPVIAVPAGWRHRVTAQGGPGEFVCAFYLYDERGQRVSLDGRLEIGSTVWEDWA